MRSFASKLNIGLVRSINQDQVLVAHKDALSLLLVCDGMGGAKAGEVASAMALKHLEDSFKTSVIDKTQIQAWLNKTIHEANQIILESSFQNPDHQGMGTTLVAALISDETILVANIGDSRAYVLTQSKLIQVTEDHSLVNDLIKQNKITLEESKIHPQRSVLTQVLGVTQDFRVDFYQLSPKVEALLLCSDGLHGMLNDASLENILLKSTVAQKNVTALEKAAMEKGAFDNIAIALMRQNA